jgi:hypothetical protein
MALLVAVALLALSAALLVGTFAASTSAMHAERLARSAARADGLARRGLADALGSWTPGDDSLTIGQSNTRLAPQFAADDGVPADGDVRITRVSRMLFAITSEARVGRRGAIAATRRYRLLVERRMNDSGVAVPGEPTPIARWSLYELY